MDKLHLIEARVNVMQKEIREVLTTVNADLEHFFSGVMKALEAVDARVEAVEGQLKELSGTANRESAPTVERPPEGKEI